MSVYVVYFPLALVQILRCGFQAASVIAQEAGCIVTGGHNAPHDGVIDEANLTGRKYLVVRPIAGSAVCYLLRALVYLQS
jgi:hypothetical protein